MQGDRLLTSLPLLPLLTRFNRVCKSSSLPTASLLRNQCKICRNPFSKMFAAGVDIRAAPLLRESSCFLQNLSRIKDMTRYLYDKISSPCCHEKLLVKECLPDYTCENCGQLFAFSWCDMELYNDSLGPRGHCA